MKSFRDWLVLRESFSTSCKIGLYPAIDDAMGQYPPQYALARSPDVITYIDIAYDGGEPESHNGQVMYNPNDKRLSYTVTDGKKREIKVHVPPSTALPHKGCPKRAE